MEKDADNLTPAMKQFHYFKQKYPDAVGVFSHGRFLRDLFRGCADRLARAGLVLTSRGKSAGNPIPLAGPMIESDCPFISPHPVRNIRPNEPALAHPHCPVH
jgi:DNA mismatch repair ATPase MutS